MPVNLQAILCAACATIGLTARADVFILAGGGVIQGEQVEGDSTGDKTVRIKSRGGGIVTVAASRIERIERESQTLAKYRQVAPLIDDTIDAHWQMAEWCRENHLNGERKTHLLRVVALDGDHVKARLALGYTHLDGRWMTRDQWRAERGYVYYDGRWLPSEEAELARKKDDLNQSHREWMNRLKRLREELPGENGLEARGRILAIRDPEALGALAALLRSDPYRAARVIYVQAVANVGNFPAAKLLVHVTLSDPDEEVFQEAFEQLVELDPPNAELPYIESLKENNNSLVNRAAFVLGRLGSKKAIGPLIESLVTTHEIVLNQGGGSGMSVSPIFARPPAPGESHPALCRPRGPLQGLVAGNKTQTIRRSVPNQEVLSALVKLSGGHSFGFDKQAWRNWHDQETSLSALEEKIEARGD